ncbi:hypothetical protein GOP47_0011564 [Adiantum capillus-veneris]|uniref:Uncharacterized protein n=1 Tax=Adiantum capillus-veneris TaxID=13818 RepID=A0A9D4UT69_ADICA|nr:hypothetical protein GOP47_0011564 [Adiantum capillus-veneris]
MWQILGTNKSDVHRSGGWVFRLGPPCSGMCDPGDEECCPIHHLLTATVRSKERMVKTGKYYASSLWITPHQEWEMQMGKIKAIWTCMIHPSTTSYQDIVSIFVNNEMYATTHPRAHWFHSRWQGRESPSATSVENEHFDIEARDAEIVQEWSRRTKTSCLDLMTHSMQEMLIGIVREVIEDETSNQASLRLEVVADVHGLKDATDNYAVGIVDVQVTKLEEQIFVLRKEVEGIKIELNKLNAIVCRFSNLLNRAGM